MARSMNADFLRSINQSSQDELYAVANGLGKETLVDSMVKDLKKTSSDKSKDLTVKKEEKSAPAADKKTVNEETTSVSNKDTAPASIPDTPKSVLEPRREDVIPSVENVSPKPKRKPGRPKKAESNDFKTTIYIPADVLEFLEDYKKYCGGNRNVAIIALLRKAMENT